VARIRPVYDTLVLYGALAVRLLASLGFMVIAGRKLSTLEFASLGIILALAQMLGLVSNLWVFWTQRAAARRDEQGGPTAASPVIVTGLALSLAYTPLGVAMYLGVMYVESRILNVDFRLLAWGAIYVGAFLVHYYLRHTTSTLFPRLVAVEATLHDITRLLGAYLLLVEYGLDLRGAVIALSAGSLISMSLIIAWYHARGYLAAKPDWSMAKSWLRTWRAPLLHTLTDLMRTLARPFLSWTTRNDLAVAYLNVGFSSQTVLTRATGAVSSVAYSLSLRRHKGSNLRAPLTLHFLVVGGIMAGYIALARPIATLYNPIYDKAAPVVVGMAIVAFLSSLAFIFRQIIIGHDTEDYESTHIGKLMQQVLVLDVKAMLAAYAIAAPVTYVLSENALATALALTIALAASRIQPIFIYARYVRDHTGILPLREAIATISGSTAAFAYSVISGAWWIRIEDFWPDVINLAQHLAAIELIYIIFFIIISKEFRLIIYNIIIRFVKHR